MKAHLLLAGVVAAVSLGSTGSTSADAAPGGSRGDIVSVAGERGDLSTLVAALEATGLDSTLRGAGPFTVFAPTDAAFAKLPPGELERLLGKPDALAEILELHVVAGRRAREHEMDMIASLPSVAGPELDIEAFSERFSEIRIRDARIVEWELHGRNGVIHLIDTVLLPQ